MTPYVITFIVMVGVFMIGCFAFKLPVGVSMLIAALCGALEGGLGTETIRMMVEGEFGYVDTILTIGCAMIFMKVIEGSGALDALSSLIIEKFHRFPAVLLVLIMLIIMFPGMITGSSTASVLSAGSIMAPVLMMMGVPALETASILAMGGILGMMLVQGVLEVYLLHESQKLNDAIPSDQRATLISVDGMAYSLLMIPASPLVGAVGDAFGQAGAGLALLGGAIMLSGVALLGKKPQRS